MFIRPAIREDIPTLQKLYGDTILSVGARDYNSDQVAAWASTAENADSFARRIASQYFYVAETATETETETATMAAMDSIGHGKGRAESVVIGFASLEIRPERNRDGNAKGLQTGYFDLLYVHKDYQRRGVASCLLAKILEKAQELRLAGIDVEASITARPFFEKHNFRISENQTVFVRGVALLNYKMRLEWA